MPSSANASAVTLSWWPVRVYRTVPVARSQTTAVRSWLTVIARDQMIQRPGSVGKHDSERVCPAAAGSAELVLRHYRTARPPKAGPTRGASGLPARLLLAGLAGVGVDSARDV